jgi:hypothetical protein
VIPLSEQALDVLRSLCPTLENGLSANPIFGAMSFSRMKGELDAKVTTGGHKILDLFRAKIASAASAGNLHVIIQLWRRAALVRAVLNRSSSYCTPLACRTAAADASRNFRASAMMAGALR